MLDGAKIKDDLQMCVIPLMLNPTDKQMVLGKDVLPDFSDLKDRLTARQLDKLRSVLVENASVFVKNKADMGSCNSVGHRIDLEADAVPHHEGAHHHLGRRHKLMKK